MYSPTHEDRWWREILEHPLTYPGICHDPHVRTFWAAGLCFSSDGSKDHAPCAKSEAFKSE
jgi:hypothetical protein